MVLSTSQFFARILDVSKRLGVEIANAISSYGNGDSVKFEELFAKNTKLKSVRNWNPSSAKTISGVTVNTTYETFPSQYIEYSTPTPHGLKPGDYVTTFGFGGTGFNTTTQVYDISSSTTFTIRREREKTVYAISASSVAGSKVVTLTNGFTTKNMAAGQQIITQNGNTNIYSLSTIASIINSTSFTIDINAYSTGEFFMDVYGRKTTVLGSAGTGSIIAYIDSWIGGSDSFWVFGEFSGVYDSNSNVSVKTIKPYDGREATIVARANGFSTVPMQLSNSISAVSAQGGTTVTLTLPNSQAYYNPGSTVFITGLTGGASSLNNREFPVFTTGFGALTINTSPDTYTLNLSGQSGVLYSRINGPDLATYFSTELNKIGYNSYIQLRSVPEQSFTSTLTSGSNIVTLSGLNTTTNGLVSGQTIVAIPGKFAVGALVKTILNSTSFTVTSNHIGSGSVSFSITGGTSSTIIVESPIKGSCVYNSYVPNVTFSTSGTPFLTYTSPSNISQLGFHSGKCPKLASTFMEYSALSEDRAESMLNELNSSCNG